MPTESRQAFTTKEKLFIRDLTKTLPRRHRYEAVSDAFKKKYRRVLSKTTYYSILRQKNLDNVDELNPHLLRARKLFVSKYPELEMVLIERLETLPENVAITPNLVFEIANAIYEEQNLLPDTSTLTASKGSVGQVATELDTVTVQINAGFKPETSLGSLLPASESGLREIPHTVSEPFSDPQLAPELVLQSATLSSVLNSDSHLDSEKSTTQYIKPPSQPRIGKTWCYRFLQRHGFKYAAPT